MQTPDKFAHALYEQMDHQMDDWKDQDAVRALIRARDAEVAAETLRKVAGELNNPAATPEVESVTRAIDYIYDEADRIEREAGEQP